MKVQGNTIPQTISIEPHAQIPNYVEMRLRENVTETYVTIEGETVKMYEYDEYVFNLQNKPNLRYKVEASLSDWLTTGKTLEGKNIITEADERSALINDYIRERYTQSAVEAIINNYLQDNTNANYIAEFNALQAYRAECKARASGVTEEA